MASSTSEPAQIGTQIDALQRDTQTKLKRMAVIADEHDRLEEAVAKNRAEHAKLLRRFDSVSILP